MLKSGDQFPQLTLHLVGGETVRIPGDVPTPYAVLLFYRGNWCRHSMRQLAAFEGMKVELEHLGVTIYGASVDTLEQAQQTVRRGLTFPVAYGLTKEETARFGAWWVENRGGYIFPAEFLMERGGEVFGSLYTSGGSFGIKPEEAAIWIARRDRRNCARKMEKSSLPRA
jgi:peroxiredoxin